MRPALQDARCPSRNARSEWSPRSHRTEEAQPTRLELDARLHTSKEITTARDAVARRSYTRYANQLSRRCSSTPSRVAPPQALATMATIKETTTTTAPAEPLADGKKQSVPKPPEKAVPPFVHYGRATRDGVELHRRDNWLA